MYKKLIAALATLVAVAACSDSGSLTPNGNQQAPERKFGVVKKHNTEWAFLKYTNKDEETPVCVECGKKSKPETKPNKKPAKPQTKTEPRTKITVWMDDPYEMIIYQQGIAQRSTEQTPARIIILEECTYESECGQRASQFRMIFQVGIGYVYEDAHFKGKYFKVPESHPKKIGARPPYKDHRPGEKRPPHQPPYEPPGCQGDCGGGGGGGPVGPGSGPVGPGTGGGYPLPPATGPSGPGTGGGGYPYNPATGPAGPGSG